jgi:hypothetical protein
LTLVCLFFLSSVPPSPPSIIAGHGGSLADIRTPTSILRGFEICLLFPSCVSLLGDPLFPLAVFSGVCFFCLGPSPPPPPHPLSHLVFGREVGGGGEEEEGRNWGRIFTPWVGWFWGRGGTPPGPGTHEGGERGPSDL